ncbi:hypothetical protein, partial [Cobetia amphilecti]
VRHLAERGSLLCKAAPDKQHHLPELHACGQPSAAYRVPMTRRADDGAGFQPITRVEANSFTEVRHHVDKALVYYHLGNNESGG